MAIQADPTWRIVQEFAKAHWSPDGMYIYLRFSGSTYAVPLQRGSMLPPAPSEVFLFRDAVAVFPGAGLISEAAGDRGPNPTVHVLLRVSTQRNL